MDTPGDQLHKRHQQRHGKSEKKKKNRLRGKDGKTAEKQHNPRAFTFSGGVVSVQRKVQRSLDKLALKEREEKTDKTPDIPPPYVVVVQGPPGVGKTTLIRSLVKHYTRHSLQIVQGPVTLVASKQRRLTFVECSGTDVRQMLDLAKIADLVLLLIDADFGFEMETFEFINILQVHGFPRVIGVLTHLDKVEDRHNQKALRRCKKQLKSRFWTEIYEGAKLFYLTGLQYGRYKKREILNLSRYIAVQKFAPLSWRSAHPYLLALRCEPDCGSANAAEDGEENGEREAPDGNGAPPPSPASSSCVFYGYVRGSVLRQGQWVHIPGAGDFQISSLSCCPDPCPPPQGALPASEGPSDEEGEGGDAQTAGLESGDAKRRRRPRSLKEQQRAIYAPGCDVGNIRVDADAMYIHLPDTKVSFTRPELLIKERAEKKRQGSSRDQSTADDSKDEDESDDESEDESDDSSEEDEDGVDLGAGKRPVFSKKEKQDAGEAIRMVRQLQEAETFIDKQLQTQELRLLPHSTQALTTESKTRQLVPAAEEEGSEDEEETGSEDEEVEHEGRHRRRAPMPPRREPEENEGGESDSDSDDAEDQEESDTEREDDDEEEEEEKEFDPSDENDEIAAVHEAARKRFARPPSLKEIIYFGRTEAGEESASERPRSLRRAGSEPGLRGERGGPERGKTGLFASGKEDRTIPLFEDEEEEETREESGPKGGLLGNLPPVLPSVLRQQVEQRRDDGRLPMDEDSAFIPDPVMYAAVGGEAENGEEEKDFWSPDRLEEIKARFFITGGWSSAEEEEKKKAAEERPPQTEEEAEEAKRKHQAEQKRLQEESRRLQMRDQATDGSVSFSSSSEHPSGACASIGSFVRVCVERLPRSWLDGLSANRPVLLGGLCAGEQAKTFIQVRVKKHRWFPRVLKSDDVLLFSAGWRRFQSLPMYALEDRSNARVRYLKYTPEHLHCLGYFWAPGLPPATPILAIRDTRATANFRISATGLVLQTSPSVELSKKLKLLGEPKKIFKNTAFIKNMFNSDLEVNMCMGAKIQTVSGIRGQVKKALGTDGTFRATFEDKILMSDLVVCKTWIKLQPRQFCNPVLDVEGWQRLRTQAEIRQAFQLPTPTKPGSHPDGGLAALQAARRSKEFNPIRVPKQLMLKLPFHARTKLQHATSKLRKLKGKALEEELDLRKPLVSAYDRRVAALLQRLQTIKNARVEKRKEQQKEKRLKVAKVAAKKEEERARKQTEMRKRRYVKQGKIELGMRKKMRLGGGGKGDRNEDD
ncbi:putative ribosome biogenesis protein BMS1 [Neospora caninum Liverpool]|uniref:Putative ribosome biogenesis protein BMS1 n=1 Tax=Neospora caninum (strain Liverpool) TaxID=572307 RepID=F0VNI8_NEOCL|nr:putative ribosome biogenesis protein BMS1 [Neospora caninum Liverpool]CBZ55284.1 putative ribosome biogenesis protein BMS1 [Neospora caninum Liverpool]CEL70015.1 TPA: ribosome biogenesis protein BMS1, putative [Neospora caninum Liverpool]|eukprot:XP_003885312.1 putative ribosome biogenesis protein BMS1 [Neospora caninum Liverpool]